MSKSFEKLNEEVQDGQHRASNDAVRQVSCPNPLAPFLGLDSMKESVAQEPKDKPRKRRSDQGFAMASYNSAFLENLFEDIAASSSEEESNKDNTAII